MAVSYPTIISQARRLLSRVKRLLKRPCILWLLCDTRTPCTNGLDQYHLYWSCAEPPCVLRRPTSVHIPSSWEAADQSHRICNYHQYYPTRDGAVESMLCFASNNSPFPVVPGLQGRYTAKYNSFYLALLQFERYMQVLWATESWITVPMDQQ